MTIQRPSSPLLLALLLALLPATLQAQEPEQDDRWSLCRPSGEIIPLPELGPKEDGATHISADRGTSEGEGISHFSGDVVMLQSGRRIEADEARYDQANDLLNLDGNVRLYTDNMALNGNRASLRPDSDSGEIHDAQYHFRSNHAFGSADVIIMRDPEHTELSGATYTTCDPDKVDWLLKARQIDLDESTNTGEARHLTVEFKGVPFLYLPYLNFPLKGRKTGLLPPTLGSSDKTGTDISVPWYWNIAPNYDATLTPRYMSARGTQLQGEFRYLHPGNRGQLNMEMLPGDDRYNNEDRSYTSYQHNGRFGEGWTNTIVYNGVSDTDYFNDLGNSQARASTTHLERRVDLAYRGIGWDFRGRVQDYQALSGSEPYQRLPQLRLNAASPHRRDTLQYTLASELVHFAHDERAPTGNRMDLTPGISLPLEGTAWFLTPRFALRHTQYQLQNQLGDETPTRTTPITSLDGGLFFERELSLGERPVLQTLEPRLYYLYVPYRDQDELPRFDTGEYDFTFAQLFRDNRFSGPDRQGDANQITLALTSRLLDQHSGNELLRASIGQIRYFADRRVTLTGSEPIERQTSDIVAELGVKPVPDLDLAATTRWNPEDERGEVLTGRARYAPDQNHLLSFDYRYRRDQELRQTDIVAYWPLTPRWRVLGRWNYDLQLERSLETVAGVAWEDCCWALHFAVRQRLDTVSFESNNSFMLTLELKGLSSLGKRLEDELETFQTRQ
ncbi:LPS-assembly protein LptD [Sulfurivermis fontis]|uniref:LPS-assembly protein LptD n=1 Tax=Sulfurivermis fontis TaxID=1972068 RepID=UPI000FD7BA06|nr:LPS assembly protein LptD [Sulfurivermis fontis]